LNSFFQNVLSENALGKHDDGDDSNEKPEGVKEVTKISKEEPQNRNSSV